MPKKKSFEERIDELAIMIGKGFSETASRDQLQSFEKHAVDRFDAIEQRLERIEFQTSSQERRVTILEDRILQLAKKSGLTFN